jgi:hypothetical protein
MANPAKTGLEDELERLTRDFVASLVAAIRNASFADVAALSARHPANARAGATKKAARTPTADQAGAEQATQGRRVRQTAEKRAELSERVVKTLRGAGSALGVRALSSALGVPPDILAAPLRELRDKGIIHKHGDKRATTYSA